MNASIYNNIFSPLKIIKVKGYINFSIFIRRFKQVIFSLDMPYPFCLIRYITTTTPIIANKISASCRRLCVC
jgi:hypothetical protein